MKICPDCGDHLDDGEVCDCHRQKKTALDAATSGAEAGATNQSTYTQQNQYSTNTEKLQGG